MQDGRIHIDAAVRALDAVVGGVDDDRRQDYSWLCLLLLLRLLLKGRRDSKRRRHGRRRIDIISLTNSNTAGRADRRSQNGEETPAPLRCCRGRHGSSSGARSRRRRREVRHRRRRPAGRGGTTTSTTTTIHTSAVIHTSRSCDGIYLSRSGKGGSLDGSGSSSSGGARAPLALNVLPRRRRSGTRGRRALDATPQPRGQDTRERKQDAQSNAQAPDGLGLEAVRLVLGVVREEVELGQGRG